VSGLSWPGCADPDKCDERAARCPQRNGGGLVLVELKTRGSRRALPLPPPLIAALRKHRQRRRAARIHAGTVWANSGMVFTTITGRSVARRDHSLHWTAFLEGAGVRPARLHDARHTAATFLLVQGVDQRVVMSMFGWTSTTMTARYRHLVPELVEEANRRMSQLLWGRRPAIGAVTDRAAVLSPRRSLSGRARSEPGGRPQAATAPASRSGETEGSGPASRAPMSRWSSCSEGGRSGTGSTQARSRRTTVAESRRWSGVAVRRRTRRGPGRVCARARVARTSV